MNVRKKTVTFVVLALVLMLLTTVPIFAHDFPGTGTPGYWKNHPEAWPVDSVYVRGCTDYPQAEAIAAMNTPVCVSSCSGPAAARSLLLLVFNQIE